MGPATAWDVGAASPAVDYMIVVTGSELLSGAYADSHTHFVARTLRPLGLRCVGSISVDDEPADIQGALRYAMDKASLTIVTGGLGPTANDVTRDVLADFTGVALRESPELLQQLERRFARPGEPLRENLRRQIRVPTEGRYLNNGSGTAAGLVFEFGSSVIVALPGPPRELQRMVVEDLVPYLTRKFGTRLPGCLLKLRFVGIGQSRIAATLKDHVPLPPEVTVTTQFSGSRVDYSFSRPSDTPRDHGQLEELKQTLPSRLGDYVYAADDTSLEEHVMSLLASRKQTIAMAEAGSSGHVAAGVSSAKSASSVLAGAYVATTEEQLRQLLRIPLADWDAIDSSSKRIERIAYAAADSTDSHWALAIGDPHIDDAGGRFVEVVFKKPDGTLDSQHMALNHGSSAKDRLSTGILDRLRRELR